MKFVKLLIAWSILSLATAAYLGRNLIIPEKSAFIPGKTTHGHYQIELQCTACHTPFMGVKQDACMKCHAEELKDMQDSHPLNKFNDPRNYEMIKKMDARKCITCHSEHKPHQTDNYGVSVPGDFCANCHQEVGNERLSHKGLAFTTCNNAGCHNYHDNRALYEDFLVKHHGEKDFLETETDYPLKNRTIKEIPLANGPSPINPMIHQEWLSTAHAQAGINCNDCHTTKEKPVWNDKVSYKSCQECHTKETAGFLKGKHGMRLAADLSPMKPELARLEMNKNAAHQELNCISCHSDHRFDLKTAAVDACLKCHNDQHSLNYKSSSHFELWRKNLQNEQTNTGVSCATCHMPRLQINGETTVEHNQSLTIRPNEKMARATCMKCHGLEFTLNSLADNELIKNNFKGNPEKKIKSLDWAKEKEKEKK